MDLLFLAHRAPFPPDRGDRIRSAHILHYLAQRARVHLVALDEAPPAPPPDLSAMLASCTVLPRRTSRQAATLAALASGRPVSLAAFASRDVAAAVRRVRRAHAIEATYVFSGQMAQYLAPGERAIVDFVDVDSAKFAQLATETPAPMAWLYAREARLLNAFERRIARRADASLFVTDAEAALFRERGGEGRIAVVENGIDVRRFDPAAVAPAAVGAPIVFTGQMDYAPNIDAATWFVRDILPQIRRACPGARAAIVGRAPTAAVWRLAGDGVIVTGEVADVRPWLAAASVAVAPLRLARGVQNKVLEAMAMALPVVATAAAAQGIDDAGTIAVADDPAAFAAAVADLLVDADAARRRGLAARRQVERRYAWVARLAMLDRLLDRVMEPA